MIVRTVKRSSKRVFAYAGLVLLGGTSPAWSVSLSTIGSSQPVPEIHRAPAQLEAADNVGAPGSTSIVPLMAADMQARQIAGVDAPANGAAPLGKPVDDVQFVKQATESGRKEISSAQEALPQLKDPGLKQIAEMLVADHGGANER